MPRIIRERVGTLIDGITGPSAYQVAVANGFVGTAAEWLASLKGVTGDSGPPGPMGPMGPEGPAGSAVDIIGVVDGGAPGSAYGGTTTIDGGTV